MNRFANITSFTLLSLGLSMAAVGCVATSPDADTLAPESDEPTAEVAQAQAGQQQTTLPPPTSSGLGGGGFLQFPISGYPTPSSGGYYPQPPPNGGYPPPSNGSFQPPPLVPWPNNWNFTPPNPCGADNYVPPNGLFYQQPTGPYYPTPPITPGCN